jgi:hypothetical protein
MFLFAVKVRTAEGGFETAWGRFESGWDFSPDFLVGFEGRVLR